MAEGQEWCLQCGAGAPGSLATPRWRSGAAVIAAAAILAVGAAAAGYAALSKGTPKAGAGRARTALATAPSTPAAGGAATTTTPPAAAGSAKARARARGGTVKPPKIPLSAVVPKPSGKSTGPGARTKASPTGTTPSTPTSTKPSSPTSTKPSSSKGTATTGEESKPTPILLDTNAASTYNPYGYPASSFGDPHLAIDGETSTAWTAAVIPATAPKMAVGLLIDLKSRQRLSKIELVTSTLGMTVQVYGANGHTPPASITDPAWTALSASKVAKKRRTSIPLRHSSTAFTFVVLWISRAGESSVGTPEAPGHVAVNEIELLPAS